MKAIKTLKEIGQATQKNDYIIQTTKDEIKALFNATKAQKEEMIKKAIRNQENGYSNSPEDAYMILLLTQLEDKLSEIFMSE